jgi:hypothetical protein
VAASSCVIYGPSEEFCCKYFGFDPTRSLPANQFYFFIS